MSAYVRKRLLMTVPVLIASSVVVFLMMHIGGEDPARMMLGEHADAESVALLRQELGLDRPIHIRYLGWIGNVVQGDFGRSILRVRVPVGETILKRLPVTIELAVLSMALSLVIAIPVGILAAVRRNSRLDVGATCFAMFGLSMPGFVMAIGLILIFAVMLRWLPPSGFVPFDRDPLGNLKYMILPTITMGTSMMAVVMRMMRSSLLEVIGQDYIRTAHAKGLVPRVVVARHALKNASIPVVTMVGIQVGHILAGSVIVETIFALPGMGKLAIDSIVSRDFPMVQGVALVMVTGFVLTNLIVDLLYGFLDPRIKYG